MNPWQVSSPCTPACAVHSAPPLSTSHGMRRVARLRRQFRPHPPRERARALLGALGIRLDTNTPRLSVPAATGTLIVANHISWLDVVALAAVEPATFLAKREVGEWPLLGRVADRLGTVFIDRTSLRELPRSVAEVADVLRSGRSVIAFPEGTTTCAGPTGGFRRAVLQAALDATAPVRPVSLEYRQAGSASTIAAFLGEDTLLASVRRVCTARDLSVRVRARPALEPAGNRRLLAAAAERAVRGVHAGDATRKAVPLPAA